MKLPQLGMGVSLRMKLPHDQLGMGVSLRMTAGYGCEPADEATS